MGAVIWLKNRKGKVRKRRSVVERVVVLGLEEVRLWLVEGGNTGKGIGVGNWREREWESERMDAIRWEMREEKRRDLGSETLERIRWRTSSGRLWSRSESRSSSFSSTAITSASELVVILYH